MFNCSEIMFRVHDRRHVFRDYDFDAAMLVVIPSWFVVAVLVRDLCSSIEKYHTKNRFAPICSLLLAERQYFREQVKNKHNNWSTCKANHVHVTTLLSAWTTDKYFRMLAVVE